MRNRSMHRLIRVMLDGDSVQAVDETRKLRNAGVKHEQIISDGVEVAMNQLDTKCTLEQFNLLEIMLVGRTVMAVMKELYPQGSAPPQTKGTIVIGSLEGDIHDLGKNIFKMVLAGKGYRAVDCGRDCPVETLIDTAEQEGAKAIGISGLITTVIPQVCQVREKMMKRGLEHIKILAGGATLKQAARESLNVDFVAETTFDGVRYLDQVLGGQK